jgi:glyoxylase-like metal-dependent hydrolase (beta-lactamase superfamily II)
VKINDHLYVVGGGDYGYNLSNQLDANVYVLDAGDELWMIDAGFDGGERVLKNMRADGLDLNRVTKLFVTHSHADHAGALAYMRESLDDHLQICISERAAPAVRVADEEVIGLRWAKSFGFYPSDFTWEPCDIDVELTHNQAAKSGDFELTAIETDGHCNGHLNFLVTGNGSSYLFSGDHVFWGGKIILQNVADSSVQEYAASMNRLLEYEFEALMPGHLNFSLEDGRRHVQKAADQFNRIGLPPSLL